jgi:hypothetical protein
VPIAHWADRPRAGPWPVTSRLALPRSRATRDPFRRRKTAARKTAARVGDRERGVRGSDDPSDVLADRSRLQKSTGGVRPIATEGEEPSEPTTGLAAPGESSGRRKRAGSRIFGGKAEIPVAGSHQNRRAKARPFGSTCRRKAFWVDQAAPFDEGAGEAILGASSRAWSSDRAQRGVRQRASEVVRQRRTWPTTPRRGGTAHRAVAFDSSSPEMWSREESGRMDRSWGPRRQARSTWGRVAERRAGAAVADELRLGWWRRSARRKPRARESRDPRVLVS